MSESDFDRDLARLNESQATKDEFLALGGRYISILEQTEALTSADRVLIYYLAALRCMADITPNPKQRNAFRKLAEKSLRESGLYYGAWAKLVCDEFDGDPMTELEVAQLEASLPAWLEERVARLKKLESETARLAKTLEKRGVEVSVDDVIFILSLISMKEASKHSRTIKEEAIIQLHSTGRTEQAWFDLVNSEFAE